MLTPQHTLHPENIVNDKWGVLQGSTRFVDMEMSPGARFMNYYWMEGPLSGDRGCRITVLHSGQERQCSNCLRTMLVRSSGFLCLLITF